jgi:hypothetical protein
MAMDDVFKASAIRRRRLLDERQPSRRSAHALEQRLPMSCFSDEASSSARAGGSGGHETPGPREAHLLNPVPIRRVHDRWSAVRRAVGGHVEQPQNHPEDTTMEKFSRSASRPRPAPLAGDHRHRAPAQYTFGASVSSSWKKVRATKRSAGHADLRRRKSRSRSALTAGADLQGSGARMPRAGNARDL